MKIEIRKVQKYGFSDGKSLYINEEELDDNLSMKQLTEKVTKLIEAWFK